MAITKTGTVLRKTSGFYQQALRLGFEALSHLPIEQYLLISGLLAGKAGKKLLLGGGRLAGAGVTGVGAAGYHTARQVGRLTKKAPAAMIPALGTAAVLGSSLPDAARRNMLHIDPASNFTSQALRGVRYASPEYAELARKKNVFM